jgi:hypothetical protein
MVQIKFADSSLPEWSRHRSLSSKNRCSNVCAWIKYEWKRFTLFRFPAFLYQAAVMEGYYFQDHVHKEGELDWLNCSFTSNNTSWNPIQMDSSVGKETSGMQNTDKIALKRSFLFFFFLAVLVFKFRALDLQWAFDHLSHAPSPFYFGYFFWIVSHICTWTGPDCNLSTYAAWIAGMTSMCHHA